MPQYYLDQAGVKTTDFRGPPGFSGSHDATIREVESGSYDAGALNEQVWKSSVADGTVKRDKVRVVFTTPGYPDYRWLGQPDLDERFGAGFTDRVTRALVALDPADPKQKEILELFGAERFVKPDPAAYTLTKEAVDKLGLGG
jgi:phosphonate transport system substrate-binding protein